MTSDTTFTLRITAVRNRLVPDGFNLEPGCWQSPSTFAMSNSEVSHERVPNVHAFRPEGPGFVCSWLVSEFSGRPLRQNF